MPSPKPRIDGNKTKKHNVETHDHASLQRTDHERDTAKFKGKYRVSPARKKTWDYGSNAAYFVTICTKNRMPYFGTIDDEIIRVETQNFASLPTPIASPHPANECPYVTVDHTRMHATPLGDTARRCWMEIPNHFPFAILDAFVMMPDHVHGIIVINKTESERDTWQPNQYAPQSKNLASIIRGFKIGVTKYARQHEIDFAWQARYHDRIVREDDNLGMIRFYIESNPLRWANGTDGNDSDNPPKSFTH